MAIGGSSFRGADFHPGLYCLPCLTGLGGVTAHGRQECHPHDGGRQEKKSRDWHGTVYGILRAYEGGKSPRPRAPALPSSLCNPPLGRSSGRVHPENVPVTHTSCPYHNGKVSTESSRVGLHYSNKAAAGSIV